MPHHTERLDSLKVQGPILQGDGTQLTADFRDLNLLAGMVANAQGVMKVDKVPLAAVDSAGGIFSWQNPEVGAVVVNRLTLDVTTQSTGACSVSAGMTATSGTTSAANLIDTASVAAAVTIDNISTPGTNGKALQKVAAGKWVTCSRASGASAGLVGFAYVEYFLI